MSNVVTLAKYALVDDLDSKTVGELVAELSQFPPNARIVVVESMFLECHPHVAIVEEN